MDLQKLFEMHKKLDELIIKEKGLEGQDLLPNTVLALQVEIGELANEWRGFKHWSNDRKQRTKVEYDYTLDDEPIYRNLVLEEYVDCLHFFLSIANQLNLSADDLYVFDGEVEGDTSILFTELLHNVGMIIADKFLGKRIEDISKFRQSHFQSALFIFYALGEQRFGFTYEQIINAYMEKDKINHKRQINGY